MMLLFLYNGGISTVTLVINMLLVMQLQQMTVVGEPFAEVWPRSGVGRRLPCGLLSYWPMLIIWQRLVNTERDVYTVLTC